MLPMASTWGSGVFGDQGFWGIRFFWGIRGFGARGGCGLPHMQLQRDKRGEEGGLAVGHNLRCCLGPEGQLAAEGGVCICPSSPARRSTRGNENPLGAAPALLSCLLSTRTLCPRMRPSLTCVRGGASPPCPALQAFRCKVCNYTSERRRPECGEHPHAVERVEVRAG